VTRTSIAIVALVTLPFAAPFGAVAQQSGTMRHIGLLGNLEGPDADAFRQGLGETGYVEGQNLAIEYRRFPRGSAEGLTTKAAQLVRLKVEVIFAQGPAALAAAAQATRQIPIVAFDAVTDPVEAGFVKSVSRPGGNVTGVFLDLPELIGKWLELLRETIPHLSRVAVLWDPATGPYQLRAARSAGRILRVRLQTLKARNPDEFEGAFAAARREQAEAMILLASPVVYYNPQRIAELAAKTRLPAIALYHTFPEAGGLMSYGLSGPYVLRSTGVQVGKILNGAKPGDLPIERPAKLELVINLKTATALGLTIPQSLLLRGGEVIR
jgi:putative ABC transport system substrate-binding protein